MSATDERPQYSVVVPVYESDHTLTTLVERLQEVFTQQVKAPYEIILVDDGSRSPSTWPTCERLAQTFSALTAIRLMRNYGRPNAILCGLTHSRGHFIITIDDDLQQRPEDIPVLIRQQSHDVVIANFHGRHHTHLTVWGSWLKNSLDRLVLGVPYPTSPLMLFNAKVAQGMLQIHTPHPHLPALWAAVTQDFVSVLVPHEESRHGRSRYTFSRRIAQFFNLLINNSTLLLRGFGVMGLAVATGGFGLLLLLIGQYLFGTPLGAGWRVLIAVTCLFAGLLFLALGIVGEYLLRILDGISHKPPYLVRTVVGVSAPRADGETGNQGTSFFPTNREHDRTLDAVKTKPL
jgi:glycosyltransferase involved in cell wall biosynthesis